MIKDDIRKEIQNQERTMMWLIRKTKIPRSTFYWKLDQGFTEDELKRIGKVLGVKL